MYYFNPLRHPWRRSRALAYAGCGEHAPMRTHSHRGRSGGASFGVRRPLRYLSHQLELDESQTRQVAAILNQLKTEQEQARLDHKRSVMAVASLLAGEAPLAEEVRASLAPRVTSAERLQQEVSRAIEALCRVLDADQREQLADLLSSGAIAL